MIRSQSPSSKATNELSTSSLSTCVIFASDSQDNSQGKNLICDHWNEQQSQQQFTSNTSCPLLEDPNTNNYRKSAHQTNTTHVSPGAVSEQTPIRRYPKQIHHVNWKRITKDCFYQKLELKKTRYVKLSRCSPNIFVHLIALFRCTAPVNPGKYRILGEPWGHKWHNKATQRSELEKEALILLLFFGFKRNASKCFKIKLLVVKIVVIFFLPIFSQIYAHWMTWHNKCLKQPSTDSWWVKLCSGSQRAKASFCFDG